MQLRFNLKPVKYTAHGRLALLSKIQNGYLQTIGSEGIMLASYPRAKEATVRFYSLQKFNRKTKVSPKGKRYARSVVRPAHWVAWVYTVPAGLLKLSGIKIYQHTRTFTIEK